MPKPYSLDLRERAIEAVLERIPLKSGLSAEEREDLNALIKQGKGSAWRLLNARILLKSDASEACSPASAWTSASETSRP